MRDTKKITTISLVVIVSLVALFFVISKVRDIQAEKEFKAIMGEDNRGYKKVIIDKIVENENKHKNTKIDDDTIFIKTEPNANGVIYYYKLYNQTT